jgi:elongation factor P
MIKAGDLTKNSVVEINGDPHVVEQLRTQSPSARGASTLYKVRFRNVRTGMKLDQTFKGDDPVKETDFDTRLVSFSFREGNRFTFMDLEDYSQFELMEDEIEDSVPYLVDGMEGIKAWCRTARCCASRCRTRWSCRSPNARLRCAGRA